MHSAALTTIAATGFTVALLHASLPTHWMPFIMVGRARGWTRRRVISVVALAGGGHVAVTTLIGVAIAWLGFEMSEQFDEWVHRVIAGLLLVFALFFWWRQVTGRGCGHVHAPTDDHSHGHGNPDPHSEIEAVKSKDRAAIWSLFVLLALSPCEAFLPVYLTAVPYGWRGVILLSAVLALGALGGMLVLTWLALVGWERLNSRWLEHYEAGLIGSLLGLLAVFVMVMPE